MQIYRKSTQQANSRPTLNFTIKRYHGVKNTRNSNAGTTDTSRSGGQRGFKHTMKEHKHIFSPRWEHSTVLFLLEQRTHTVKILYCSTLLPIVSLNGALKRIGWHPEQPWKTHRFTKCGDAANKFALNKQSNRGHGCYVSILFMTATSSETRWVGLCMRRSLFLFYGIKTYSIEQYGLFRVCIAQTS